MEELLINIAVFLGTGAILYILFAIMLFCLLYGTYEITETMRDVARKQNNNAH